ncbi:MAG: hypothetical protein DMG49_20425 [Acidobacteria bacterium]|nr:MAG: hypothetical protein DMG49_20425 [Acidobacteriota bacterium]
MQDPLSIFVPAKRRKLLIAAGVFGAAIALLDWWAEPYLSFSLPFFDHDCGGIPVAQSDYHRCLAMRCS